jgi:hypothetical protein
MNKHEELIHRFYNAFQQLDTTTMMSCYHDEATFTDAVFNLHSKKEIQGMWTMLCQRAKNFELTFEAVQADDRLGSAHWEATYLFSRTNRTVVNKIDAQFRFKEGLIIEHTDSFSFWTWSKQALGLPGFLLGWTSFLQTRVQHQAAQNLKRFIARR